MPEIPDSWVWVNSYSGAATDLLILPATPGLAHVIDEISVAGYDNVAAANGIIVAIKENGVVALSQVIAAIMTAKGGYESLGDSWSGPFAGAGGAELRISQTNATPVTGANPVFRMRGHAV